MISLGQTVVGQRTTWSLVQKLGEGDAGEVYLVEPLLTASAGARKTAILKRPRRSAFAGDALRQAAQIRREGKLLQALAGVAMPSGVKAPALLDESRLEDGFGERSFIVIERAPGYDLVSLHQVAHSGLAEAIPPAERETSFFLKQLAAASLLPAPLLIRILAATLALLETIHHAEVWLDGARQYGLLWNDVKPEHLYWDPCQARLTVIDWGNGQVLEADGVTKDRQYARHDDDAQFLQAMGAFLSECNPDLYRRLEWPSEVSPGREAVQALQRLRQKILLQHQQTLEELQRLREEESERNNLPRPQPKYVKQIQKSWQSLATYGEMPDLAGGLNFHARLALQAIAEDNLEAFRQVCAQAAELPIASTEKWRLLQKIADLALQQSAAQNVDMAISFCPALAAGVADDWPALLWQLFAFHAKQPEPAWWTEISRAVRRLHFRLEVDALPPYPLASRVFYTLQSALIQAEDQERQQGRTPSPQLQAAYELLRVLDEEIIKKWREPQPAPPNAGVDYTALDNLLEKIETYLPTGALDALRNALFQARTQASVVLEAWERHDFEAARRALRPLLVADPDRWRLLAADQAIESAVRWWERVRQGAAEDEPFYDYLTAVELQGRNLRSQVGAASWLDTALEVLKRLRKGMRPADLLMEHPQILSEIPWLSEHRSREVLALPRRRPLGLERDSAPQPPLRSVSGVLEGSLGPKGDLTLQQALDSWAPEARGSSARVFAAQWRSRAGQSPLLALKIMRPDRVEYALPLFREEAQILALLRDVPGVTPLLECGFLRLQAGQTLPFEEDSTPAADLRGQVVRYGIEEVQNYLASLDRFVGSGWLPYLALPPRNQEHNLIRYCDAGYTHGWFLPLRESLLLGIQICDILQVIHDRNVVYRDHKILHYYWEPEVHGVMMIDWNVARRQPQGLSDAERVFDLVQFAARALHHILTGRPAQGALPLGPNRPEEIEAASSSYAVSWTYDDERLPNRVKEILEQALCQGYLLARDLRRDLEEVYRQIPDPAQEAS